MHRTGGEAGGRKWKGKDSKEMGGISGKWVWRVKGTTNQISSLQLDSWKLPQEITFQIMSRLPVKSVMRCRCVCKSWRISLKDPHFIDMHLSRVSQAKDPSLLLCTLHLSTEKRDEGPVIHMDYKVHLVEKMLELGVVEQCISRVEVPFSVWGSCNGLLCLSSIDNKVMMIYNPFTREKVTLPRANVRFRICNTICGLGYHSVSKEYKTLWFFIVSTKVKKDHDTILAEVLTLGSNLWRSKGEVPFTIYWRPFNVLVNEALHFLVQYPIGSDNVMVTAFDIGDEEFRYLPLPPESRLNDKWGQKQIQEFGEFLSFVDFSSRSHVEIWVMKHYGVEESWFKQFVVPVPELVESVNLIWPLEGGGVLMHYNQQFVSYHPLRNQTMPLAVQAPPEILHTYVHLESLVSPRMPKMNSRSLAC